MLTWRNSYAATAAVAMLVVSQHRALAQATVVQLPTFHTFGVNTTVLVPDRGATYLGGVNYSSAGSTSRGIPGLGGRPFTNRSFGGSTGGSNVWATAHIHDFEAMEAQLLAEAGGVRGLAAPANPPAGAPGGPAAATPSIAAIRTRLAREDAAHEREALGYLQRGQEKLAEGKPNQAKIYFQMAHRRASGELKQQALAGLKTAEASSKR